MKVPWRAVSVYSAATVSIQQSTHSLRISKVGSIPFTIKGLSTSSRASTTSFKKVNPFNAQCTSTLSPSSQPAPPSTILKPVPQASSPLPQYNLFTRRNSKLTVPKSFFHLKTYPLESYRNLEASSLRSLCPRSLIQKNFQKCPYIAQPHSVNALWPNGACHCSRPPIRYLRARSPWK